MKSCKIDAKCRIKRQGKKVEIKVADKCRGESDIRKGRCTMETENVGLKETLKLFGLDYETEKKELEEELKKKENDGDGKEKIRQGFWY